jgi:HlyD family secretion protein
MISPVVLGGKHETRTFEVRTRFKDKDVVLKPGMSADIEIVVEEVKNTLVLPSQAVMEREGKKFVYVKEGSRARLKEIKTGLSDWTYTQVISGVEEADEVIFNPDVPGLQDGVRLKVIK